MLKHDRLISMQLSFWANALVIYAFFVPNISNALPCLSNIGLNQKAKNLLKISIIEKDDRMTVEEYAKEKHLSTKDAESKFSATGKIVCNGMAATAQLTGRNDLITTANHVFFDDKCQPFPLENCEFKTLYGPSRAIKIKPSTAHIEPCDPNNPGDDWAVVELESKVEGVKPYLVPNSPVNLHNGDKLIQVSAFATNFRRNKRFPKNITECSVKDLKLFPTFPVLTDCDTGPGSSGSAQLLESSQGLILQSLHNNDRGDDGSPYSADSAFNTSAPVTDDFFLTLQEMANNP